MKISTTRRGQWMRPTALLVASSLLSPALLGCGGNKGADTSSVPPPAESPGMARSTSPPAVGGPAPQKTGLSGKQKVAILAGAALLYYMYKKHQQQQGQPVQYYRSEKNGRIYYRDPKTHQAIYVTSPTQSELDQLSPQETEELQKYKGYNNQDTGEDYTQARADPSGGQ